MAKSLKKFEFKSAADRSVHNWEKYLDGGIWQLTEGEDFSCKTQTFAMLARKQAADRGMGLRVNVVEGGLVIQAVELDAEAKAELLAKVEASKAKAKAAAALRRAKAKESDGDK